MQRIHVFFSGRVQGVGFRYTCQSIAARFHVSGWVRNRSDGRVELVAEGEMAEVERFISEIKSSMSGHIHKTDLGWEMATSEYKEFVIYATF